MTDNNSSYEFKQYKRGDRAFCKMCHESNILSLIPEGELYLKVRTKYDIYITYHEYHWVCAPNLILKKALRATAKDTILNDPLLDEQCKTEVLRVMDKEKVRKVKRDNNPVPFKKTSKTKIGCLNPFKSSKTSLNRRDNDRTISKKKKKNTAKRQIDKILSRMFEGLDLGKSVASSDNRESEQDLLQMFDRLELKTKDSNKT